MMMDILQKTTVVKEPNTLLKEPDTLLKYVLAINCKGLTKLESSRVESVKTLSLAKNRFVIVPSKAVMVGIIKTNSSRLVWTQVSKETVENILKYVEKRNKKYSKNGCTNVWYNLRLNSPKRGYEDKEKRYGYKSIEDFEKYYLGPMLYRKGAKQ